MLGDLCLPGGLGLERALGQGLTIAIQLLTSAAFTCSAHCELTVSYTHGRSDLTESLSEERMVL